MQRLAIMLAALSLGTGAPAGYERRGIEALTVAEHEEATSGDACATSVQAQDKGSDRDQARAEFKAAGVCARCHVISVLEWGISGHFTVDTGTDCKSCHGPSAGHVANERNEVKPDRLPREAQIAKTCMSCHDAGCPKTLEAASCQKCHHVHALVNPAERRSVADERLTKLLERWEKFRRQMDEGDRLVQLRKWEAARDAFRAAGDLVPGNHRAATRLAMCERRLEPKIPGFESTGDDFDATTGLPQQVNVSGLGIAMVLVPSGEFDMGDDSISGARPVHTVAVAAFYLGKFELTQAEWKAVMDTNPSIHQGPEFADRERMPVENVSWDECQGLIRKLNERLPGGGFRLPTEAEWEYACRAASPRPATLTTLPVRGTVDQDKRGRLSYDARAVRLVPRQFRTQTRRAGRVSEYRCLGASAGGDEATESVGPVRHAGQRQ